MRNLEIKNNDCHDTLAMTKSVQSGRSLLPESGADAPTVLSAVYTDSTPAKNRQADVPQYGRSMIEMLGVLAIIGVLSVGGIAGYSKAMMKYRINKTIEQITLIAGNIRTFFAPQRSYSGLAVQRNSSLSTNYDVIRKAKLVPDEMWNSDKTGLENAWGTDFWIGKANDKEFYIQLLRIPEEACIELATHDWSNAQVTGIDIEDGNADSSGSPDTMDDILTYCQGGTDGTISYFAIYFK